MFLIISKLTKRLEKKIKKTVNELERKALLAAGFKDPRILLCFDSWLPYLPRNFVLVGIFREPLKVTESLKKRSNFSFEKSLNLWKIYNQNLLSILEKHDGFLLDFDWPKKRLLSEISFISEKLGLAKNIEISEWYTKKLITSGKTVKKEHSLPPEIKFIYSRLKERSTKNRNVKIKYGISKKEMPKIIDRLLKEIQNQGDYFKILSKKNKK